MIEDSQANFLSPSQSMRRLPANANMAGMSYRDYDPETDNRAIRRIWKEVGWLKDVETDGILVDSILGDADEVLVATIDKDPECAVIGVSGDMRYLDESLSLGVVAGVTTSHISRKLGFAGDLTARLLARQAAAGHDISALGMFDQGFYDKLGFGSGTYEQWIRFDPMTLTVSRSFRPPKRLQVRDYEMIHEAIGKRHRGHGGVVIYSSQLTRSDLGFTPDPFGLGYCDGDGNSLSHFIWGTATGEHGPYIIKTIVWQTSDQLLELLALIKSLGDQVNQVSMLEIGDIQLQDLLKQPIRTRRATQGAKFANESRSLAFWQLRILNLESCLAKTHLNTPTLEFNLELTDPVEQYLEAGGNWRGITGRYIIRLGEESGAIPGHSDKLPTLTASVNAFSRMWMGIRSASSLAITDNLAADENLLVRLDASLRLPKPHTGLDF